MKRSRIPRPYIAFLRGINVGGHRVKMDHLRELFTALTYSNVSTFIASGNVRFESVEDETRGMEDRIAAHLEASLGFEVATFLRTPAELRSIVDLDPFGPGSAGDPGDSIHVGFLREAPGDDARGKILALGTAMDEFHIRGRELYWLCHGKVSDSLVSWPLVAKTIKAPSTMRNLTTLRKLADLSPPADIPAGRDSIGTRRRSAGS